MINLILDLLSHTGFHPGAFRLVDYLSFRVMMAALTALVLELFFGKRIILYLYRRFLDTGASHTSIECRGQEGDSNQRGSHDHRLRPGFPCHLGSVAQSVPPGGSRHVPRRCCSRAA